MYISLTLHGLNSGWGEFIIQIDKFLSCHLWILNERTYNNLLCTNWTMIWHGKARQGKVRQGYVLWKWCSRSIGLGLLHIYDAPFIWGCWKEVVSRAELRDTLVWAHEGLAFFFFFWFAAWRHYCCKHWVFSIVDVEFNNVDYWENLVLNVALSLYYYIVHART